MPPRVVRRALGSGTQALNSGVPLDSGPETVASGTVTEKPLLFELCQEFAWISRREPPPGKKMSG
jgi:hypothetical protein